MSTDDADGTLLQGLIRAELLAVWLDHWGYFFPAHIAVWRFIREKRPSALDVLNAGYDTEPWFAGRGAHWFMDQLVNRTDFVDLVERIMYAAADHALATPAKERGFLREKEAPEVDLTAASRLARIVLDAVDEGLRTNAIK
jgi:hypothetical protein